MEEQPRNSLLTQVVGPALIILMVGSLVFFFIEVFYRGPHVGRLCWVLGLFTLASVLVSRISIQEGFQRASAFGLLLAAATFITSTQLVQFSYSATILGPIVIVALIAVVMWASSKLTWDCTVIDSSRDVSAIGLTEIVRRRLRGTAPPGDPSTETSRDEGIVQAASDFGDGASDREPSTAGDLIKGLLFSKASRRNTPGLWVFYFSMFALPVFGFGQWFVQRDPQFGYRRIFILFAVYLGAGLCLLMTTSLLGLERYLRKRNLSVPEPVARQWMTVGVIVALAAMMLVLLVPRPSVSHGADQLLAWFSSSDRSPSKYAIGNDGQQEREDATKTRMSDEAEHQTDGDSKNSGGQQKSDQPKSSDQGDRQKTKDRSSDNSNSKQQTSGEKSKDQNKNQDQRAKKNEPNEKSTDDANNSKSAPPTSKGPKSSDQRARDARAKKQSDADQPPKQSESRQSDSRQPVESNSSPRSNSSARSSEPSVLGRAVAGFMKLIVYSIGIVALAMLCILFRNEIRAFLGGLFAGKKERHEKDEPLQESAPKKNVASFAQFRDPFSSGQINHSDPQKIIEYTFSALEAWGRESGVCRQSEQTPFEFAAALTEQDRKLGELSRTLAELHGRSLFGNQTISRGELAPLKPLWHRMQSTIRNNVVGSQANANFA